MVAVALMSSKRERTQRSEVFGTKHNFETGKAGGDV
jgi:hypothetical protein